MIAYFDTIALVKRYLAEQGTEEIAALWAEAEYHAVSRLAYAEILSALHGNPVRDQSVSDFPGILASFRKWTNKCFLTSFVV